MISNRILKQRMGMLQVAGIPLLRYIAQHTIFMRIVLRFLGIIDLGFSTSGKVSVEVSSCIEGTFGQYKIRFWMSPVYRNCARWSFAAIKV